MRPVVVGIGEDGRHVLDHAMDRSSIMRRVKSRDTGPERALRRMLWAAGFRYRLQRADLPGKPDIVFPGRRIALFVHGCFWHGHDCPRGARVPKTNRDYWVAKIAGNRARDAALQTALDNLGWRAIIVWECELKAADALMARLTVELGSPRAGAARGRRVGEDKAEEATR